MMDPVPMTNTTSDEQYFAALIATHCPGRSLVREFYTSPRVFERDMERVYLRQWTFVAHASRVPQPGDTTLASRVTVRLKNGREIAQDCQFYPGMPQQPLTHDQLREDANNQLYGGWPMVLSGLKTLLETGEMLTTPGSQRFSQGPKMAV